MLRRKFLEFLALLPLAPLMPSVVPIKRVMGFYMHGGTLIENGNGLTLAKLLEAKRILDSQNVPPENRWLSEVV